MAGGDYQFQAKKFIPRAELGYKVRPVHRFVFKSLD
jgi:hypothetical protein